MPEMDNILGADARGGRIDLRAGPVSAAFEPESGFLRDIRSGGHELLRGIYAVVRDSNWGTVPTRIEKLRVTQTEIAFDVSFEAICRRDGIDFVWIGSLSGDAEGRILYRFDGTSRTTFHRNRIGFCVLHPADAAGAQCRIEHAAGGAEEGTFPHRISAHQPFVDIRAIEHDAAPEVSVRVEFEGDVFEMEDQRNWTDASFKTYSTPLAHPFPVRVGTGERVAQQVSVSLPGRSPAAASAPSRDHESVRLGRETLPLPRIGLCDSAAMEGAQLSLIRNAQPAHLRVDLRSGQESWASQLSRARRRASALGTHLEVALHLGISPEGDLAALGEACKEHDVDVIRWLILSAGHKVTPPGLVALARHHLQDAAPSTAFGAGTDAFFTELNREPPSLDAADFVFFSLNPQVHAFDNASLFETLEAQPLTVRDARDMGKGRAVVVTPVTLRPRSNPNATDDAEVAPEADPRQSTLFAAAWTLASIRRLSEAGAASATFFEAAGPRGIVPGAPADTSAAARVHPLYHLFADIGEFACGRLIVAALDDPRRVDCLALEHEGRVRLLLANLTPAPLVVRLDAAGVARWRFRALDMRSAGVALCEPEAFRTACDGTIAPTGSSFDLPLGAHALVRLDSNWT